VLHNLVLWKIFWSTREEVTRDWRKVHNEELHDLYPSQKIMWMIKSRTIRL
jgi:hypothetical protein